MTTFFSLIRIENSTASTFKVAGHYVHHLEIDQYRLGYIIYTERNALSTSDGLNARVIAGNVNENGYREGKGTDARFYGVAGFTQISTTCVVIADYANDCLRLVNRMSGATSVLAGQCQSEGYQDGARGQLHRPYSVVRNRIDNNQLLVADVFNKAVRIVNIRSGVLGTFVMSNLLRGIEYLTQDDAGNIYASATYDLLRISYKTKHVSLLASSADYKARFCPSGLLSIAADTLLVTDYCQNELETINTNSGIGTTVNISSSVTLYRASSILLTEDYLFVGGYPNITQFDCE